jgi:hypothetical protein
MNDAGARQHFLSRLMVVKVLRTAALAAIVLLPPAAVAAPRHTFVIAHVSAKHGWQNMRLRLGGRGILRFKARGTWVFNPSQPPVSGDGAANLPTAGRANYTFSGSAGREGQLIGRIGDAAPFVAGADGMHKVRPNEIGRLKLMINDDYSGAVGKGLTDNRGHLRVHIGYERR